MSTTPGPWIVQRQPHAVVAKFADVLICTMAKNTRRNEGRHNADLIAAAPELLAALREAADLRAALCRGSEGGDPTTWDAPLNRWLAAIARAEGRP